MTITEGDTGVRLNVLGEVEAVGSAGRFRPGHSRPGALLALLLMHLGETVTAERVLDELWHEGSASGGHKRVQVNVLRLRRALATLAPDSHANVLIQTRPGGYVLDIDADRVDALRFQRLARQGRVLLEAGDATSAARELRSALGLWRGDPFTGYDHEPFARADVQHLQELRLATLEDWAQAEIVLGEHARMAAELERLVARHPLRERLRALLMLALYRCRRQGDALAVYRATRTTLVEQLGIEPCRELRELEQAILEQRPALELRLQAA